MQSYRIYKTGFWVFGSIILCCVILGMMVLITYEKSPESIISRILLNENAFDAPTHFAYLPDYYLERSTLQFPHSYDGIETMKDFEEWVSKPDGVLYNYHNRTRATDISSQIHTEVETIARSNYILTKFNLNSFFDIETIVFYELRPTVNHAIVDKIHDAVLVIPGTGHQGALDVLGEVGPWESFYYQDEIARTFVNSGYVVYVIELRGYGERAIDVGTACNTDLYSDTCSANALASKLTTFGINIGNIMIDEITQVLAFADSRTYVQNIAVAGLSLGGSLAATQAIVNGDVVDAVVIASGIGSARYSPLNINHGSSQTTTDCCDSIDSVITIAPMPAYVSFGNDEDTVFRWEAETGHSAKLLEHAYLLHGKPDNFYYIVHDGGHEYHKESILEFLNIHLKH